MWAGEDQTQRYKTRVLKPPGGGSSDIFGSTQDETSPRRVKNHNQSQLGSALFGDAPDSSNNSNSNSNNNSNSNSNNATTAGNMDNNGGEITPRSSGKPDGNPVTGTGYTSETQNGGGSAMQNGTTTGSSSSSIGEKSNGSSPTGKPAGTRTRVPPGGYSSGLW